MTREYLRVTPTSAGLDPDVVSTAIASLHKLSATEPNGVIDRLTPFRSEQPVTFEFVAISDGTNEPVEFYYGADTKLDVLRQRLRSIYPDSFDIDRVEVDIVRKLIQPIEQRPAEFVGRLEEERLLDPDAVDSPTDQTAPIGADGGTVRARPSIEDVTPYGVRWRGSVDRRKDWMTSLTDFSETITPSHNHGDEENPHSGRAPLAPLIDQLTDAAQPLAFQVVFQRKPDWSRDARRRTGELLDGTDTLLQKILGFESSGRGRTSVSSGRSTRSTRRKSSSSHLRRNPSPTGEGPSRPTSVDEATRYDLVRANSPKRTFSVNLRLLALAVDEDASEDVDAYLDPLCSVFDLVDGRFYEMDGRRLRSRGYLPGSGERHARAVLERFTSRSVATGGNRFAITNRSETRPDLVLNGNELANFLVIPPSHDIPSPSTESIDGHEPGATAVEAPSVEADGNERESIERDGMEREAGDGPFSSAPDSVVHRDDEVSQLAAVLEPLTRGEQHDTLLITGPPGSGKTCTAKYTVDQLCQENPEIDAVYVNCWEDHSPFQTIYRILDELKGTADVHRQSTATDVILERLREYDDTHGVLILDEIDQLDDEDLLYDLLNLTRFSLLLIANREEDLLDGLDDRLASRLGGCERIHLDRYTVDELVDILDERAAAGLVSRDTDRSEFERIADAADGDARVAITTLRIAARRADEDAADRITQEIIERALPEARRKLRQEYVDRLTSHQKAVFRVIEEQGRIAPQELFEEYRTRVEEPKSNRTVRTYLKKLERYDLIVAEGSTRDRMYRCPESRPSNSSRSAPRSE